MNIRIGIPAIGKGIHIADATSQTSIAPHAAGTSGRSTPPLMPAISIEYAAEINCSQTAMLVAVPQKLLTRLMFFNIRFFLLAFAPCKRCTPFHQTKEKILWPQLTAREKSLVTISVLTALNRTEQIDFHLGLGLDNGLTETEIVAALTHIAFYAGWPAAMSGFVHFKKVLENRKEGKK